MLSEESILGGLYDAAAGSGTWQGAMAGLCRHVGAFGAVAFSIQERGQAIPVFARLVDERIKTHAPEECESIAKQDRQGMPHEMVFEARAARRFQILSD